MAVVLILALAFPSLGRASHGGLEYAEPLGWDEKDQKAFFMIHKVSESGTGPFVVYFDIAGPSPERPIQVGWSKGSHEEEDSLFVTELGKLRRRLRPFVDLPGPTVSYYRSLIAEDSVEVWKGIRFKRFKVRVVDHEIAEVWFEVTTLEEPEVRMIRRYRVGQSGPAFGILSFRGVPTELGYETQVPVLLSPGPVSDANSPRKIEWIRWE